MHGVLVEELQQPLDASVATFTIDSSTTATQPFQKHRERHLAGSWGAPETRSLPTGTYIVRTAQPLGILAMYLLEPASDDGFVDWNVLDPWVNERTFPRGAHRATRASSPAADALMLRSALLYLSNQPRVFKFVRNNGLAKQFASRFVAGETLDEALDGRPRPERARHHAPRSTCSARA